MDDEARETIQCVNKSKEQSGMKSAGYSGTPLWKKLGIKEGFKIRLVNQPEYYFKLFDDFPNLVLEENDNQKKILTSWGQLYDIEQLFEHAIVHILRHRRQIERFLIKLRKKAS